MILFVKTPADVVLVSPLPSSQLVSQSVFVFLWDIKEALRNISEQTISRENLNLET